MLVKSLVSCALVGSAAAYIPMMSMDMGRREVVQAGTAAAAVTPFLQAAPAAARYSDSGAKAPLITIFDHRGCSRTPIEGGMKSNDENDEMMVKVSYPRVSVSEQDAAKKLQEFLTLKEKGLDGDYTADAIITLRNL